MLALCARSNQQSLYFMFEYVLKNKEWIFSGIGVFFLAGIIGIIRYFFKHRKKEEVPATPEMTSNLIMGHSDNRNSKNIINTENLVPERIKEALQSVPLLERENIAYQYKGIQVQWEGDVYSAERTHSGNIKIEIKWPNSVVGIFFEIDPMQYKGVGLLKRGDHLCIVGYIDTVNESYISLVKAEIVSQ